MLRIEALDTALLRQICDVLAATDSGLKNTEIDELLHVSGIADPTPKSRTPYTYVATNKRTRLYRALSERQARDSAANAVLSFIERALSPVRFREDPSAFEKLSGSLNEALAFAGFKVTEAGKVVKRESVATTLDEARVRTQRLRSQMAERNVHPRILAACISEIRDDNYFHAVLEAAKSLAAEIRAKTGLTVDGVELVDQAFERGQKPFPLLAFNRLETDTERSEQRGVAQLLRGIFSAFRNPTAHEPKVTWFLSEDDALDALSMMSLLRRKLDTCFLTSSGAAAAVVATP
jgi:uncharacterized protein (TIGR02391 family)